MNEEEELLDSFYASNRGNPLGVAKEALIAMDEKYKAMGIKLQILAAGTTGYGEMLFSRAFSAETHAVETVAHARATAKYTPDATFLLDIGGQDMKAIWLENGVITNILVNEACSSGCGSFLENFAATLHISADEIAKKAFESENPAELGSRCTVFMTSNIVTEQRNGKSPEDIMAGLCRSIIENVFTKVIRVSNLDSLGEKIVVQGGTFENDAVLCALEQYVGRPVVRAPYPGIMGAIGATLLAKEDAKRRKKAAGVGNAEDTETAVQRFIGLDALESLTWKQEANVLCPFCTNHCQRAVITFSNGNAWITNNRCERGEILGDPKDKNVQSLVKEAGAKRAQVADLYKLREQLLFADYLTDKEKGKDRNITIGIPRVLMFWENMSFWTTFWKKLGFQVQISASGSHQMFEEDKVRQLTEYMKDSFGMDPETVKSGIAAGNAAMEEFHRKLKAAGKKVLEQVRKEGRYAVVLASRPYQNDGLINHGLPKMMTELGVPVLTADSLPGIENIDLSRSRLDVVNNFHGRMLASAIMAARDPNLEYVQLVSFGCGHDAYLSDEIQRLMREISGKSSLILKLDESEVQGPLRIRVRSFIETINIRRRGMEQETGQKIEEKAELETNQSAAALEPANACELPDPYPVKFTAKDRKKRTVLVPNTSHAFCRIMSAALVTQGIRAVPMEIGREEAIRLGKKYVHNDICFPAQIVIGEALAALESGQYEPSKTAIGMGKYIGDCRLTHYGALLRKALDDAGYSEVAILTNDDTDYHNLHPGFKMNLFSAIRLAAVLPAIDILEELLRKMRPQVLIVGEYLLNFHPGANHEIERYLEKNGFEIIEARMTDVIRKTYFCRDEQIRTYHLKKGIDKKIWYHVANQVFEVAHAAADKIAKKHELYTPASRLPELAEKSEPIIPHTFDAGEGILIPGEIIHHAEKGCRTFVILQPFGCLPNHVVGRGIVKKLRECYPDIQVLPLDYDPNVSFANLENRLQMLIMNVKEQHYH